MRIVMIAALAALCAGAPALAQNQCAGLIEAACLSSLGAGSTPLPESDCGKQLANYRSCLAGAATAAAAVGGGAGRCSEARAERLWAEAKTSNTCAAYQAFRSACPAAPEAHFAAARMGEQGCLPTGEGAAEGASVGAAAAAVIPRMSARERLLRDSQTELGRIGLYASEIDGMWGPGSRAAMRRFQAAVGVSQDGEASPAMLGRLKQADGVTIQAALAAIDAQRRAAAEEERRRAAEDDKRRAEEAARRRAAEEATRRAAEEAQRRAEEEAARAAAAAAIRSVRLDISGDACSYVPYDSRIYCGPFSCAFAKDGIDVASGGAFPLSGASCSGDVASLSGQGEIVGEAVDLSASFDAIRYVLEPRLFSSDEWAPMDKLVKAEFSQRLSVGENAIGRVEAPYIIKNFQLAGDFRLENVRVRVSID